MEREGQRSRRDVLRDGTQPDAIPEALPHVRLQVDARQVPRGLDAVSRERLDDRLAVGADRKRDDVDEPRALVLGVVVARELETAIDSSSAVYRAATRRAPRGSVELLELPEPDRGADVVDPVVEAEPHVLEPAAGVGAALVAQALRAGATRSRSAW